MLFEPLSASKLERIVVLYCNPVALALGVAKPIAGSFRLERVMPIDRSARPPLSSPQRSFGGDEAY